MTEDIDEIRERKLRELQDQQQQQESDATTDADAQRDSVLKQILTEDARQRLKTVRLAHEENAELVESRLLMMHKQGQLSEKVTDEQLKAILERVAESDSSDFSIRRR